MFKLKPILILRKQEICNLDASEDATVPHFSANSGENALLHIKYITTNTSPCV